MKKKEMESVVSIGGVLMLMRMPASVGIVCGIWAVVTLVIGPPQRCEHQKWRRFLGGLCAMVLALSETVRYTMEESDGVRGRFSMWIVLVASVASGSCFRRWTTVPSSVCTLLSVSALAYVVGFSLLQTMTGPKIEELSALGTTEYVWLVLASDYLVSNVKYTSKIKGFVEIGVCVAVSTFCRVDAIATTIWPFLFCVFPCVCAWQRQRLLAFHKILGAMKEETMLYCIACVGVLALCCAVYEPLARIMLSVHFGLRWAGPLLLWFKKKE